MILCLVSLAPLPGLVLIPLATHGLRPGCILSPLRGCRIDLADGYTKWLKIVVKG